MITKNISLKKSLLIIICLLILVALFYFPKNPSSEKKIFFNIEKGEGSGKIASNLEKEGLISWGLLFRTFVLARGVSSKLQAGAYELSPSMSIAKIANKFTKGETAKIEVTIPEGFTMAKIESELNSELQNENLKIEVKNQKLDLYKNDYDFLSDAPDGASLEGYLFPDTYFFDAGMGDKKITEIFLKNFGEKLTAEMREEIKKQNKTIFEIITMASIIEKEVITQEDKKMVSGIFWKRMKVGMALDSCATIAYVLGVDKWRYSYEDTRTPSPYNTYLNPGLPPGPICNPGIESITAAIYPEVSPYWYYLSTPEGETIFSRNLEEHNIAKAKYLR